MSCACIVCKPCDVVLMGVWHCGWDCSVRTCTQFIAGWKILTLEDKPQHLFAVELKINFRTFLPLLLIIILSALVSAWVQFGQNRN